MASLAQLLAGDPGSKKAPKAANTKATKDMEKKDRTIDGLRDRIATAKEYAAEGGRAVLLQAERQATLFALGVAEGRFGHKAMSLGPVHVPLAAGIVAEVAGLAATMTGHKFGDHLLAVSDGTIGAFAHSAGQQVGLKWRAKKGLPMPAIGDTEVGAPLRDVPLVRLTPPPEAPTARGGAVSDAALAAPFPGQRVLAFRRAGGSPRFVPLSQPDAVEA